MNFINIDLFTLTKAIGNSGWTKSVNRNPDGSLEWYGETGYPTTEQIQAELDKLAIAEEPA